MLAQSTQLDAAAKAHNDYQIINNTASHFENPTQFPIGFTGINAVDRARFQGYVNIGEITDEFVFSNVIDRVNFGELGIRSLLNAPYHMASLMRNYRDVGLSIRASNETTPVGVSSRTFLHANLTYKTTTGPQQISTADVKTYPCQGSTGIFFRLANESPNPVPGRDLSQLPLGSSVYVMLREGQTLVIATATMRETLSNTPVVMRAPITSSNDPNGFFRPHEGYVVPDAPLKPSTQYSVRITGSNTGTAFVKSYSFTTGS